MEEKDEDVPPTGVRQTVSAEDGSRISHVTLVGRDYYEAPQPRIPLQRPPRAEHFTGRDAELAKLLEDLQPGRAATLCGPGGIGKSALAAEAIWTLAPGDEPPERFPHGIITHNFYNQPQAAVALEAICRAYGEEPKPTPKEAARRALAGRKALVFLDGTENVDSLQAILDVRGGCGVLVTSRTNRDALAGWEEVSPLPTEQAAELLGAWAGEHAGGRETAREICQLVGGLPLAVRLVGRYLVQRRQSGATYLEWLRTSPLEALNQGERQTESVPLLLERSLGQVSGPACEALSVVGVLALGPFQATSVAEALQIATGRAEHVLGELVSYGLLLRPGGQYEVSHRLIRTYARDKCRGSSEAVARLGAHYGAFVREQRELGLAGYARLDDERSHAMAVLSACVEREAWEVALNLSWAIEDYLGVRGYWTERVQAIEAGVAAARALNRRRHEGARLGSLGNAYADLGQVERAIDFYQQAIAIAKETGDRSREGTHVGNLGLAYRNLGQVERAIEYHEQALAIAKEIGDRRVEGSCLGNLGNAYAALGQVERAIDYMGEAVAIFGEIRSPYVEQAQERLEELRRQKRGDET